MLEQLVEKMREDKKNKELQKITGTESIDIFDQISDGSPWGSSKE